LEIGVSRRIDRVYKALRRLEKLLQKSLDEILLDELEPVLEREVEVIVQGLLDLGEYIISRMGWEPPSSYREIALILGKNGVLGEEDALKLARLAGLRNIVVHLYADIDYNLLYDHAKRLLDDARKMLSEIIEFMENNNIDP